jgi:hypothetical protein
MLYFLYPRLEGRLKVRGVMRRHGPMKKAGGMRHRLLFVR